MAIRGSSSLGSPSVLRTIPRNAKIAVVGGDASGLSAAYLLKRAGYSHVTVFEKESRLGGKCRTVMLNGRSYELGAIVHVRGA
jgi:protoporphyrinogen oxidase